MNLDGKLWRNLWRKLMRMRIGSLWEKIPSQFWSALREKFKRKLRAVRLEDV